MVLEDSCGAATASAEACDENPNCSAAAEAAARHQKSCGTAHLCRVDAACDFISHSAAALAQAARITACSEIMEWLQDRLLRLAARYYCQDIDIDAARLRIEKWDSESCKIKATDLRLTNEQCSLSVAECTVDVSQGVSIETQGTILIAAPWKSIGAVMTDGWRGPAVSLQAAVLEVRAGGAKLRIRNAAITANTTDSTANWDVAVASFHNDHIGEARGVSATLASRTAIGERRCDATTRKLAKAEVEVIGGDTGLIVDTPFYALVEEAAPHLARVGEEGLFCAFKCSRFVARVLGIDLCGHQIYTRRTG